MNIRFWNFKQFIYKYWFGFWKAILFPVIRFFKGNKTSYREKKLLEIKKEWEDLYGSR